MKRIEHMYINGAFVRPHGTEIMDIINPATETVIGTVTLGDADDVRLAVAAAKQALPAFSRTSKSERISMLTALRDAVLARADAIRDATINEYGGPVTRSSWVAQYASQCFEHTIQTLEAYEFTRSFGTATVVMEPVGVAALLTPWNSTAGSICSKLATALAAGCTSVIKPSELSPLQTQVVTEALHSAGLPKGVFNVITGRGDVTGAEISAHPDIAKISFTGSSAVGKMIMRAGADTMKRLTLELSGKSPSLILEDADLAKSVALALSAGFQNSGQACIAGTRILVPRNRLEEVIRLVQSIVAEMKVGDPKNPETVVGPVVSRRQYERIQQLIKTGLNEGATLVTGGEGRPDGLERGFFVKPTVFANVTNTMTIAREEIFGPVLSILTYANEDEAIAIANDCIYGLQAYVFSSDVQHARAVASQLQTGGVLINGIAHEPAAPFGGFKQSGIGREFGVFGLESYLEPKTILEV